MRITSTDRALPLTLTVLIGVLVPVVLSGCSADKEPSGGAPVASVARSSPPATSDSDDPAGPEAGGQNDGQSDRPQLRVDTSDAEHARLLGIWTTCLKQQGVPTYTKAGDGGVVWAFPEGEQKDHPKAYQACRSKQPISPAATDPDRNPEYADDFRDYVKCINRDSKIIKVRQTKDGWTWADDDTQESEAVMDAFTEVDQACELEAFGRE
jgi:hypothetical protein